MNEDWKHDRNAVLRKDLKKVKVAFMPIVELGWIPLMPQTNRQLWCGIQYPAKCLYFLRTTFLVPNLSFVNLGPRGIYFSIPIRYRIKVIWLDKQKNDYVQCCCKENGYCFNRIHTHLHCLCFKHELTALSLRLSWESTFSFCEADEHISVVIHSQ